MHRLTTIFISIMLLAGCCAARDGKATVGEVEYIDIAELGTRFLARIDTGARSTSVHAVNIVIDDPAEKMEENVGKVLHFTVVTSEGQAVRHSAVISAVQTVRNSQGVELRYRVPMTLVHNGVPKRLDVNLRDRSSMTYRLLIGRDWLADDYLVDVSSRPVPQERASHHE